MSQFLEQLRTSLSALDLSGRRVLVAISGGADSVALLLGLCELQAEHRLEITAAHLDHMLRGKESTADAEWVKSLCDGVQVSCVIESRDVKAETHESKQTLEESARDARYEFLQRTATEHECTEIAVAHTADDQAETVLHHILRGTGLSGLRGIPRVRELSPDLRIVRPLLDIRRADIEGWLKEQGQEFRLDETNTDPAFTRNRIRHQLMPVLESQFNPQVIPAINRLSRQAGELSEAVDQLAEVYLQSTLIEQTRDRCLLDCSPLGRLPTAVRRVCLTLLWKKQNWPRQRMSFAHWNELAVLVTEPTGAITLPGGVSARRGKEGLVLAWNSEGNE